MVAYVCNLRGMSLNLFNHPSWPRPRRRTGTGVWSEVSAWNVHPIPSQPAAATAERIFISPVLQRGAAAGEEFRRVIGTDRLFVGEIGCRRNDSFLAAVKNCACMCTKHLSGSQMN